MFYVMCVCLHIVVSNAYCVVFLLCLSSSCISYVAILSGLSIFDCPFGILPCLFTTICSTDSDIQFGHLE